VPKFPQSLDAQARLLLFTFWQDGPPTSPSKKVCSCVTAAFFSPSVSYRPLGRPYATFAPPLFCPPPVCVVIFFSPFGALFPPATRFSPWADLTLPFPKLFPCASDRMETLCRYFLVTAVFSPSLSFFFHPGSTVSTGGMPFIGVICSFPRFFFPAHSRMDSRFVFQT